MENISQFVSEDRDSNALDYISAKYSQVLCIFSLKKDKKCFLRDSRFFFLYCDYLRGVCPFFDFVFKLTGTTIPFLAEQQHF